MLVPVEGLRLQAAYAYLNSKIQKLSPLPEVPAFFPGSHLAIEGGELPYTPHHKFTADLSYKLPLDESVGEVTLGTTFSYTGKQFYQGPSQDNAAIFLGAIPGVIPAADVFYIKSYSLWNLTPAGNVSWAARSMSRSS